MDKSPTQRLFDAIRAGDVAQVAEVFAQHPEELRAVDLGFAQSWLHFAAREGQNAVIDLLLAAGMDVDYRPNPYYGPPLMKAVDSGQLLTASFLISRGANVNLDRELIGAINSNKESFALVKLLVESGTDVNRWWYFGDPARGIIFNALSWAITNGKEDIAEYLRAHGAIMPPTEPRQPPKDVEEEVIAYFEEHFGPVQPQSLEEIVPTGPPIAIHVIPASQQRQHVTLFTTGMSFEPMTVPPELKECEYAELFIQLPADWPYADIANANHGWPVHWLRTLAAYPHEQGTWPGGAIIVGDEPPEPISPNAKFTSILLMAERRFSSKEGYPVQLYRLTPLYPEERELERKEGIAALMRAFDEYSVPFIVDLQRRNVAKP